MLAKSSQNRLDRLQLSLASARTRLANGQAAASRLRLNQILTEAEQHGFVGIEWEARLVITEWESKLGMETSALTHLRSLEQSAPAKSFGLIAHKAQASRERDSRSRSDGTSSPRTAAKTTS